MTERPELLYPPIYDEKTNTTIYRVPLAEPTGEAVLPNAEDDGYSIYIAEDLTDDEARRKAVHAIEHVVNNDHGKADVQQIEADAHYLGGKAAPAPKKPTLLKKKKKEKRLFTALDLALLKRDPFLAELLEIPRSSIPKKPNDKNAMSQEEFEEIHDMMEMQQK